LSETVWNEALPCFIQFQTTCFIFPTIHDFER